MFSKSSVFNFNAPTNYKMLFKLYDYPHWNHLNHHSLKPFFPTSMCLQIYEAPSILTKSFPVGLAAQSGLF